MQLQTKFRIWVALLSTALLIDAYMTFLFSRGQISAGELALSVIIVHSTRGTLSTILIGSAIFESSDEAKLAGTIAQFNSGSNSTNAQLLLMFTKKETSF